MSANPSCVDWQATASDPGPPPHHAKNERAGDPGSPLQEGNRVLESIARQEALHALLTFSDLHEQIRNRRATTGCASARDLFETERFILSEVLQLICDRVQAITQADGIVVALAEGSSAGGSAAGRPSAEGPKMVCRAAAGPLSVGRGVHLIGESEFLQDCLESGRILRSDDCEIDARVELDFARAIGARSTVLVPLRGRHKQLGVLQAFSGASWAFSDHDIRCFDLFAELVLSALKPEDQDRRVSWLSDVAGEVLRAKPVAVAPMVAEIAAIEVPAIAPSIESSTPVTTPSIAPTATSVAVSDLSGLEQPVLIPAATVELPEPVVVPVAESKVESKVASR